MRNVVHVVHVVHVGHANSLTLQHIRLRQPFFAKAPNPRGFVGQANMLLSHSASLGALFLLSKVVGDADAHVVKMPFPFRIWIEEKAYLRTDYVFFQIG